MQYFKLILVTCICCLLSLSVEARTKKHVDLKPVNPLLKPVAGPTEENRMNPHGLSETDLKATTLGKHTECLVCHSEKNGKVLVKANPELLCKSCHGATPHVGVAEHLGKLQAGESINCLSCHYSHRANDVRPWSTDKPQLPILKWKPSEIPQGWTYRPHTKPRLKKTCEDCHS